MENGFRIQESVSLRYIKLLLQAHLHDEVQLILQELKACCSSVLYL